MVRMTDAAEDDARAAAAEEAVAARYLGGLPGLAWGRAAWPMPATGGRAGWHYWWSAHLVDAAIDAAGHRPGAERRRRVRALVRGIRPRNGGTWSRRFFDDLAWMGLALQRGTGIAGRRATTERIAARIAAAVDPAVGAVPWRVGSRLFNAPANGPAAILLARTGRRAAAMGLADWIDRTLRDPATGLVLDGVVVEAGTSRPVSELYTYCQGVALGAALELAPGNERFTRRAAALVEAIATWTGPGLVLPGAGGGDGGLFAGIACRYLAAAARRLPPGPAASARALVRANAEAVWTGRAMIDGMPLFAADWRGPADPSPAAPERDLSVQLGAWIALEAAIDTHPAP
jgi:predicted alpha-1,6-mannanase (GH76 family)